MFYILLFTIV